MRHFLLVTMLAWASLQAPQTNDGVIEGKVVRVGSSQDCGCADQADRILFDGRCRWTTWSARIDRVASRSDRQRQGA